MNSTDNQGYRRQQDVKKYERPKGETWKLGSPNEEIYLQRFPLPFPVREKGKKGGNKPPELKHLSKERKKNQRRYKALYNIK